MVTVSPKTACVHERRSKTKIAFVSFVVVDVNLP